VKGLEKLTSIRLAEALTQRDAIPNDVITDALYAQDRHGESFVEALVATGHITEWDLAKTVVEQFQVPFLMASSYDVGGDVRDLIDKDVLFEHCIVPIDRFENILTLAMPILTPVEVLSKIRRQTGCEIYPYVGLVSENKNVLTKMFPEYADWQKESEKRREQARVQRAEADPKASAGDWTSIFDSGDEQVRHGLRPRSGS
jgi:hypothetical protein